MLAALAFWWHGVRENTAEHCYVFFEPVYRHQTTNININLLYFIVKHLNEF